MKIGLDFDGVISDCGKFEINGFYPTPEELEKIVLKWHEAAMSKHLPESLKTRVPTRPEDILILDYDKDELYCIDHVFERNNLPFFNSNGELVEPEEN